MKRSTAITVAALVLLAILTASVVAGCGSGVPSTAVATVGKASITQAQFQELLSQVKAQSASQGQTFPVAGSATYKNYTAMIVDYLVQAQVVAQSASTFGVSVSDKQVADQVAQIEKSYGGQKKLLTMALLKESLKDQMLAQAVATKVVAKASVSAAQIKSYWQAHAAKLRKSKKTDTFAKAKATIRTTLLSQAKSALWSAWLTQRTSQLGVKYAAGFDPAALTSSPKPIASASPTPGG